VNSSTLKRTVGRALLSGSIAVAGLGLAVGSAQADPDPNYGPHQWCPGQSMEWPTGPWNQVIWDMGRCHTWYVVGYGKGNVPERTGSPSDIYEGPNPPPNNAIRHCPPIAFMCP
jgi:hypothetical protein